MQGPLKWTSRWTSFSGPREARNVPGRRGPETRLRNILSDVLVGVERFGVTTNRHRPSCMLAFTFFGAQVVAAMVRVLALVPLLPGEGRLSDFSIGSRNRGSM